MKELKQKKCKACKELFTPFSSLSKACSPICALKLVDDANKKKEQAKDKDDNKKFAAKKKEFWANDLKTRKDAAKLWCHAYIRERDKGNNCICCNKPMTGKVDAGHWIESGNYPAIRYDEDNIHAQSVHCNRYKGGDSGDYERNLREKIGDSRVDDLLSKKNIQIKRTCEDYKAIEEYYKAKLKALKA